MPIHLLIIFHIFLSFNPGRADFSHCSTTTPSKTFEKCTKLPTQDSSVAWTFHPRNSTLDLAFSGTFISPSGWVGFGLNPTSPEMTGLRALIAFPDPNSGQLVLLPYILEPSVKLQKGSLLSRPLDIHLLSSSATLYGGRMATIHNGANVQIYATVRLASNKTRVHFVWNRGLYVQGYSPTIHPTTADDLSSVITIDVLSGLKAKARSNLRALKIAHGAINAVSWGLLLPLGAFTARYLRNVQSVGPAWFYAHAGLQITAVSLGTVGFSLGLKLGEMSPGKVYGLHRKLGFAVFCLGWLQALALLFRPKTTHKFRKYWKSYHHFVGYACVVLGVVNCFQGFDALGDDGSYAKLGYSLCLSTLMGLCVALEVNAWVVFCRKAKEEKLKREGMFGSGGGGGSEKGSGSSSRGG